jgi:hypothetical protein
LPFGGQRLSGAVLAEPAEGLMKFDIVVPAAQHEMSHE